MKRTTTAMAGIALAVCATGASAGSEHTAACYNTGLNAPEQLGDRNGHMLQVSTGTCLETGGGLEGMVTTQNTLWEHDPSGSKILSGDGVGRRPGGLVAYRLLEGSMQMIMKEGKPTGWIAKGKGVYTLATGDVAHLAGKTFTWTTKPMGSRRYQIDAIVDD